MKSLFAVVALSLIATPSFAAPQRASEGQISSYQTAVGQAFDNSNLTCDHSDTRYILTGADEVYVDSAGPQPALIMIRNFGGSIRVRALVTTDASYSKIMKIVATKEELQAVNHGNMINPQVSNDWVVQDTASCAQK